MNEKECKWYLKGSCCKDVDAGRVWDCTAPNKRIRIKSYQKATSKFYETCPYPKLNKET